VKDVFIAMAKEIQVSKLRHRRAFRIGVEIGIAKDSSV